MAIDIKNYVKALSSKEDLNRKPLDVSLVPDHSIRILCAEIIKENMRSYFRDSRNLKHFDERSENGKVRVGRSTVEKYVEMSKQYFLSQTFKNHVLMMNNMANDSGKYFNGKNLLRLLDKMVEDEVNFPDNELKINDGDLFPTI